MEPKVLITMFTTASHWSLNSVRWIQYTPSHPISLRSILISMSHLCLGLPSCIFFQDFLTKILYALLSSPMCYMSCPSHPPWLHHPNNIVEVHKLSSSSSCSLLQPPDTFSLLGPEKVLHYNIQSYAFKQTRWYVVKEVWKHKIMHKHSHDTQNPVWSNHTSTHIYFPTFE